MRMRKIGVDHNTFPPVLYTPNSIQLFIILISIIWKGKLTWFLSFSFCHTACNYGN